MPYPRLLTYSALFVLLFTPSTTAYAQQAPSPYSQTITGFLGLNTVPSARMDEAGSIRIGASALDPFVHGFIGVQIAEPLYVQLRQTSQTSGIFEDADKLLPGMDFKVRLLSENAHRPAIALGVQSALGHKRMAGEFIALSKRHNNFDFTAGLGWGRYGTAAHFDNPFGIFGSHFTQRRDISGEEPNAPSDWFTGKRVGFFGGIEYFLPYDGLSLKLDYGADRYTAESDLFDYNAPPPWSAGLAYNYKDWAHAAIGIQGTDKIMGRLSLKAPPAKWPFTYNSPTKDITKYSNGSEGNILHLPENANSPELIGLRAKQALDNPDTDPNEIVITLKSHNLTGPTVHLSRRDIENAVKHKNRSPNEIWQNTTLSTDSQTSDLLPRKTKPQIHASIGLENQLSLSEEDSGTLYRTSALLNIKTSSSLGFMGAASLRVNLFDNLDNIKTLRPQALLPVRSDIDEFADNAVNAEHLYGAFTQSITPELHAALSAGYLEEFYAGFGGEILYRPVKSRFAVGLEAWQAFRRDPNTTLAIGLNGQQVTTGHLNLWYDIPYHDITAKMSAGRFLAGDTGITFELEKEFLNGARLTGQVSLSNASDPDIFGNTTHAYHSIALKLPIGSVPYIPDGSYIKTEISPLGRDIAQSIHKPINLYRLTEPFTSDHIAAHWQKITQ